MQISAQILLGWASIAAGITLAAHTLGLSPPRPRVAGILRSHRPAERPAHERVRPMDPAGELQRLTAIAESGFAQIELIAELHGRAAQELEAADDGLARLLAEYAPGATLPAPRRETA